MKKFFATLAVLVVAFGFAGCAAPRDITNPAQVGQEEWSAEYITDMETNQTIACLWNRAGTQNGTLTCDWENLNVDIPDNARENTVGNDGWEYEFVEFQGKTIKCLWNDRGTKNAVRSCDHSRDAKVR